MKYVVMLGDGMADTPVEQLGNKTPLEAANKPCMDFLAQNGTVGTTITVPGGMPPGSARSPAYRCRTPWSAPSRSR